MNFRFSHTKKTLIQAFLWYKKTDRQVNLFLPKIWEFDFKEL